jgi:molybdopterin adenylyltransferase
MLSRRLDSRRPARQKRATVSKVARNVARCRAGVLAALIPVERTFMADIPIGVVTVSDRASRGVYEDKGGPGIEAGLADLLASPWRPERRLVPDERPAIEAALIALADVARCPLILTTGGTGPAPRDVTPEATEAVCDRLLPGFGELMRSKSLAEVPTAILSRQVAGTRGQSLIINLPGKPAAIRTCLDAVFAAVPYCIDLIGGPRLETNPEFCLAFRPKG